MEHLVIRRFKDKVLGEFFSPGAFIFIEDIERVEHLEKGGFIQRNKDFEGKKVKTRKKASD